MASTPPPQPAGAAAARPAGIPDSPLAGPFPVGEYAAALRKRLDAEGLLQLQAGLPRPLVPGTIGVITGRSGKAHDDLRAALARRGWAGRLVWGFAPVQDRHAAPAITQALCDLAAVGGVEV